MKNLDQVKTEFLQLIGELRGASDIQAFMEWLKNDATNEILGNLDGFESMDRIEKRKNLDQVAMYARSLQPNMEAICPSEQIHAPTNCPEGLNFDNTAHVDAFLYDEVDVEEMTNDGKIPTHYCRKCGWKDIGEVELLTHSCSRVDLEFIFHGLLPDLNGKVILDVGSRIGAVIFGAYVLSNSSGIVGIEMNPDLCNLAAQTAQKFNMQDRLQIVNAELSTRIDLVRNADVIVLNNVFDWFVPIDVQVNLWQLLRQNIKKGALMVTVPSIEEALQKLPNNAGIDVKQWVQQSPPFRPSNVSSDVIDEKCDTIKLYSVIGDIVNGVA